MSLKAGNELFRKNKPFDAIYLLCCGEVNRSFDGMEIAHYSPYVRFGLEEWITNSKTWLTDSHCIESMGIQEADRRLKRTFAGFFYNTDEVQITTELKIKYRSCILIKIPLKTFGNLVIK